MRPALITRLALSAASVAVLGVSAFAQDLRVPGPASAGTGHGAPVYASVSIVGCIERESDYRAAQEKSRGGLIGTGLGVKNEFILTRAASGGLAGGEGSAREEEAAYELTGPAEGDAADFVGKRVEVSGHFKFHEKARDLGLRQFTVLSVRAADGRCD